MTNEGFVTLFYKSLTVVDSAVIDPLHGLMGQSWYVDISLTGHTDSEGVIADFSKIKSKIKKIIDEKIDHKLIVNESLVNLVEDRARVEISYGSNKVKNISYEAPAQALCIIPAGSDEKSLEAYISAVLKKEMPHNIKHVEVTLRGEQHQEMFHYTHGLKQHYGNCQRLFHGHKNTMEIWRNGQRELNWEKMLIQQVFKSNIHFAFWENIKNKSALLSLKSDQNIPVAILATDQNIEIEYTSSQGLYWASLPANEVFIMPCETTIENIAAFFAQWIKDSWGDPLDKVMVVGFEGIAKGAKAVTH